MNFKETLNYLEHVAIKKTTKNLTATAVKNTK